MVVVVVDWLSGTWQDDTFWIMKDAFLPCNLCPFERRKGTYCGAFFQRVHCQVSINLALWLVVCGVCACARPFICLLLRVLIKEYRRMRIDHFAMYVNDLEGARAFFMKYFGARSGGMYHNPRTGLRTYFLTFDGGARLEVMSRPGLAAWEGSAPRVGYAHLVIGVGGKEAVDGLTERLRADGCSVVSGPRTTGDGYYESCVEGPEGCLVEITE